MRVMLDATTRDRLLRRIGLSSVPVADASGLRVVHRAYVSHVPFESLSVQLGESRPLDPDALVERVLNDGRGGYCFEVNTVLLELLTTLGFGVERREAIVGEREAFARGDVTNHMALVVTVPGSGERFIAEGGWGEGPLDPLPLVEGALPSGMTIERDGDGWWVGQHSWGTTPGYRFGDAAVELDAFEEHHRRLSTSPESGFVRNLLVQQPADDQIVTLRSRTMFLDGPAVRERSVLESEAELGAVLQSRFGITVTGERLARLWANAVAQHEERQAESS
jgi:N-hydroxyarylamine O-acetyltransferase